jgi:hypothetical protein
MLVGGGKEILASAFEILCEHLFEGFRSMKARHAPRAVQGMADIVEPDDLAVGGVKEGNAEALEVERTIEQTPGIPFSLG